MIDYLFCGVGYFWKILDWSYLINLTFTKRGGRGAATALERYIYIKEDIYFVIYIIQKLFCQVLKTQNSQEIIILYQTILGHKKHHAKDIFTKIKFPLNVSYQYQSGGTKNYYKLCNIQYLQYL